MKYKNYIKKIASELNNYKKAVDEMIQRYKSDSMNHKNKVSQMQGTYTKEYIEEYDKANKPTGRKYKKELEQLRSNADSVVSYYLGLLERQMDDYFNAPIRQDFSNKINSIFATGLQLSNIEFELLKKSAISYMELRLLNQLAESRKKQAEITDFIPETGETNRSLVNVSDPYVIADIPDIIGAYRDLKNYSSSVNNALNFYCGENWELRDCFEPGYDYAFASGNAYFRLNPDADFEKTLESIAGILPAAKVKKELTERDKKLIDVIIDPRYPGLAKQTVKDIAENSPELAELLSLDERYAEFLPETEE